jgi:hypothetical protein
MKVKTNQRKHYEENDFLFCTLELIFTNTKVM